MKRSEAGVYFKFLKFIWQKQEYTLNYFTFFIWLCWALVGAHEIFGCGMWDPVP